MRYIVFGYDGRNTLGQIRSLGVEGIKPIVILIGNHDGLCEASRYCGTVHYVNDVREGIGLLLSQYAISTDNAVIFTDSDGVVGALNENYNQLSPYFYFSNAGGEGRLNQWLNKYEQLLLAERVGFQIPQTVYWHSGEDLPNIHYPVFTKASSSLKNGWKNAASICNNEEELRNVLNMSSKNAMGGQLLVQQLVTKKDELYFEGFSICGGTQIYIPLYGGYYRLQPKSYGTYEWLASYQHGEDFLQKLKALFSEVHYEGIFEVEFLLDQNDKLYFTEINFRETAFNHVHTLMGLNLTWMYAQSVAQGRLIIEEAKLIKEPFVFINEFADFRLYVTTGKISLKRWIGEIRNCDAYIFYDKFDRKPFHHELRKFVKQLIKSAIIRIIGRKGPPG